MSNRMTRRQWLSRTGLALGGTALAGCWGLNLTACAPEEQTASVPIRMMFNENPYAPSEKARQAMTKAFEEANLYSFSRGDAVDKLKDIMAQKVGLTPDHILISAGSTEILRVVGLITGMEEGEVVTPHPTFETMLRYVGSMGFTIHRIPLDDSLGFDLAALRESVTERVKLVYLCNPNNPTGVITPDAKLRPFCAEMAKKALVFVDEAYHEYVDHPDYRSMVGLVQEGHNVIVSRTASKIHGLAGLRIGFGIAHPDLIRKLRAKLTGTNNIIGLRAAIASYQDEEFQTFCFQKNKEAKNIVYQNLENMGLRHLKSETNFVFFQTGKPIEDFQKAMEAQGIIVGRPFPPFMDWCRLSMAKAEEMGAFVQAFKKVMA
jgi:histidinol-phosphate aminotransferase